jgi:hypothetical protein
VVVIDDQRGQGYVRKLRDMGVAVWCKRIADAARDVGGVSWRCVEARLSGVYEGGALRTHEPASKHGAAA